MTLLGYHHHDLREASDGLEGLRVAREQRSDLIISDVLMPTMDGYEFVRRLREEPDIGGTPVVFSTAHYLSRESRALARKCGVASVIDNPCEPQTVLDIVAAALGEQPWQGPVKLTRAEDSDREHLRLVTDKVAEKADELRNAHERYTALIELSTELAQERDPVQLLDRICMVAREIIGAKWAMVVLLEPNRTKVEHLGVAGIHLEDTPALRSALLEIGVFRTVTRDGRTICLSDVTSTPIALRLPLSLPRAASLLVAPLVMRGHVDGWICLADKLGFDAFSDEDELLAPSLAAQMAVAYANARLYNDSKKYAGALEEEIAHRIGVEHELSDSQSQLAAIIGSAMDAIVTVDSEHRIVIFNDSAETMFRCSAAEVMGQSLNRFLPADFRARHSQEMRDFAETGVATRPLGATRAITGLRCDGEEFPLEASISQIEVAGQKLYTVILRDITDRKQAEQKLKESEQRLQSVIENLTEGLVVADLDGQLLHWNRAALKIHGFKSEEEGLFKLSEFGNIFELSDMDGSVLAVDQWPLPRVIRGETLRNLEIRIRRLDGSWNRVFCYGGTTVLQSSGSFAAVLTMTDISDRKLAEADRSRLAAIVESSEDAIVGETLDGIVTSWNKGAEKLYGYSAAEAIGQSVWLRIPPARVEEVEKVMQARLRGQNIDNYETERLTKDGLLIGVSLTISPIKDRSGALVGSSTIARDVSERKRMEGALRASELRYRRLFESAEDGVIILDEATGRIIDANPYIIECLGYSFQELLGKQFWEIGFFRDATAAQQAFNELRSTGYVHYEDLPLKTRAGSSIAVEVVSKVYLEGDAKVIQCNLRDITERKRAQEDSLAANQRLAQALNELQNKSEELAAMTQQLWQASKLATMGELAASIAHELNNPLTTVTLGVESLMAQCSGDEQKTAVLETVQTESVRMATLVSNLLQFSRLGHAQISTLYMAEELASALNLIDYHLRSHNITVVQDIATGLPACQADRQQLLQVFLNLLTNAADAMPNGGTLTVRARPASMDQRPAVMIEFMDTGLGITQTELQNIWEPFFTTKPEGKGTGLGLAICRRTIEGHGGTIEAQTDPGQTTTFRILLPAMETMASVS